MGRGVTDHVWSIGELIKQLMQLRLYLPMPRIENTEPPIKGRKTT
jgi:hypothetical protein